MIIDLLLVKEHNSVVVEIMDGMILLFQLMLQSTTTLIT